MASDREELVTAINARLRKVALPGSPGNVVSAGLLERVILHDTTITLVLNFPPDLSGARDVIKKEVESALSELSAERRIQILEKSAASAAPSTAPPRTAHAGAARPSEIPGVAHIIAVASGKGGVGKSTVAVNLAATLARHFRVGLLDTDIYGPSVPKMLGLETARPEALPGDRIRPIEKFGLQTMSIGYLLDDESPVIWRGPMVTGIIRQFLFQVDWGILDYLVLDLPPGTGDAQLTIVQSIALAGGVIVTTPQDVALLDVRRSIQMFQRVEVPILGIIENMSYFVCPKCATATPVFSTGGGEKAARRYQVPFLGAIPLEASYAEAGDAGRPTVLSAPASNMSKVLAGIADQLATRLPIRR